MQKKTFFFAGIIVCLLVMGWGWYQYQKPRAGVADASTNYMLTAEQLYSEYNTAEATADKKYSGNVIEVSGLVADVQTTTRATNILLKAGAATGGVSCSMQQGGTNATIGKRITVKGRCTGFLMDVCLVDAVVIEK